jgi:exopolysaccharide biosynthesis polyprenyl glycosylphosphotransferase
MIWRSSFNSRLAQAIDFFTALYGFLFTYWLWGIFRQHIGSVIATPDHLGLSYVLLFVILSGVFVLLFNLYKGYSFQRFTSLATEYTVVLRVLVFGILISLAVAFFFNFTSLRRTFFVLAFVDLLVFFILQKSLLFYFAQLVRKAGRNRKRVLVVGTGTRCQRFINTVKKNFAWGLDIIGLLTGDEERVGKTFYGYKVVGTYCQIEHIIKTANPEEVIITISTKRFDQIRDVLEVCEKVGIQVRLNSDFFGYITKNVRIDNVMGLTFISFDQSKQSEFDLVFKRLVDIAISLLLSMILAPLIIAIAVAIYMQDGRPVLYSWKVVGKNRKPIKSWKFRTMVRNADEVKKQFMAQNEMKGPMFKMTDDPRILPIGHLLRKYSLDELPQLFSVLKGDLSLVGPRPPLQTEFREFDLWHRRKCSVKPGITCLWQVSGRNGIHNFDDWARLDLEYIDNWSLWLDFKILFKTIPVVLKGSGK